MPHKEFALEPDGPKRLSVSWSGNYKDVTVTLDGQVVGSFDDQKALKEGGTFDLADGSKLEVKLATLFVFPELQVNRNGAPVPGSPGDARVRHAGAYNMIFVIAGLNVVVGILVELTGAGFLKGLGIGWPSVITGIIYAILGFFVKRESMVALGLAVGLFVLDGLAILVAGAKAGGSPPIGGLVFRVFLLLPMLRGFGALRALKDAGPRRPAPRLPAGFPASRPGGRPAGPRPVSAGASARGTAAAPAAGSSPVTNVSTAAAAPVDTTPAPAPVRTLTGEAEKRRLQMTERMGAATSGRRVSLGQGQPSTETVAQALRFTAHKCEIHEGGLRVTLGPGKTPREVAWTDVGRLVVRQLPPDPPWNATVLLDIVVLVDGTRWEPIRVYATTFVNYGVLPGGSSTARLENIRKLTGHLKEKNPAVALDPETTSFLEGTVPTRFANMTQFAEYDSHYH